MVKTQSKSKDQTNAPLIHGGTSLPAVTIDDFNNEMRDGGGFLGDRASKKAFWSKLDYTRKLLGKLGDDPLGETSTADFSKKMIDAILSGDDLPAAAVVMGAVESFASSFSEVIAKFLKDKSWVKTQRIAVGGGFKQSRFGRLAIARAAILLREAGTDIDIVTINHHPDDAGLIGSVHLMPPWMLKGHRAILAVDIGGTNVRAGVVEFGKDKKNRFSDAAVWKSTIWRHRDDRPSRTATIKELASMLLDLLKQAEEAGLKPAPLIGIGCPGVIDPDGSIVRGGQNLPGGNWESDKFNLPAELRKAIPEIGGNETFVVMHNDAVVQGLSQIPFMTDITEWGVLTIGTGLGNAHFTNRSSSESA